MDQGRDRNGPTGMRHRLIELTQRSSQLIDAQRTVQVGGAGYPSTGCEGSRRSELLNSWTRPPEWIHTSVASEKTRKACSVWDKPSFSARKTQQALPNTVNLNLQPYAGGDQAGVLQDAYSVEVVIGSLRDGQRPMDAST